MDQQKAKKARPAKAAKAETPPVESAMLEASQPEAALATRPITCTRWTYFVASWMTIFETDAPTCAAADEPAGIEAWQEGEHSFHG